MIAAPRRRACVAETQARSRAAAVAAATAFALAAATAAPGAVELKRPDTARYPTVVVTAVTPRPTSTPPRLWEAGRPAAGLRAENLGRARSIVLAIDRSRSMEGQAFVHAVAAARQFATRKRPADRIAIVAFGSGATQVSRFSTATIDVDGALRTLEIDAREGTALNDAVVLGSRALGGETLPARVLIVLTDGRDVSSSARARDAAEAAARADVTLYAIGIESEQFSPASLERLAQATGGSYVAAASSAAIATAYARVGAELARTWRLTYVTAARPGEALQLVATAPGLGSGRTTLQVAGGSGAGSGGALPDAVVTSTWGSLLVGLVAGLLVLGAFVLVARAQEAGRLRRRLAPHVEQRARRRSGHDALAVGSALFGVTERAFGQLKLWRKVERLLERADLPLRAVEFFYIVVGAGFALGLLMALAGRPSAVIVLGFGVGGAAPVTYVWLRARRRLRAFENQLPDLLLTLAASLKAGHSFKHGLQVVVDEGQPPASKEFQRVLAETRLGRPMEDALNELAERVGSKNLEFVVTAVTIQTQVGGSLAGLFDMVAEAVRQRQQFARKIRSLTAMGRASAYVLIGIPFFIAFAITMLNGEYMAPLYHTSTGHLLIAIGLTMMAFGSVLLKRIVSFKG